MTHHIIDYIIFFASCCAFQHANETDAVFGKIISGLMIFFSYCFLAVHTFSQQIVEHCIYTFMISSAAMYVCGWLSPSYTPKRIATWLYYLSLLSLFTLVGLKLHEQG